MGLFSSFKLKENKSLEGNPVSINSGLKPSPKEFGGNHGLKIRGILNTNKNKSEEIVESNIKQIVQTLKNVIDPETGIDIIELGLVYGIYIKNDSNIKIELTMTTSSCPLIDLIVDLTKEKISELNWVKSVETQIVWNPIWGTDMLSQTAKNELGW